MESGERGIKMAEDTVKRPPIAEISLMISGPCGIFCAKVHDLEAQGAINTAVETMKTLFGQEKVYPPKVFEFETSNELFWDVENGAWQRERSA